MKYIIPSSVIMNIISEYMDRMFDKFELEKIQNEKGHFYKYGNKYVAEMVKSKNFTLPFSKNKAVLYLDSQIWKEIKSIFHFDQSINLQELLNDWASSRWGMNMVVDITDLTEFN